MRKRDKKRKKRRREIKNLKRNYRRNLHKTPCFNSSSIMSGNCFWTNYMSVLKWQENCFLSIADSTLTSRETAFPPSRHDNELPLNFVSDYEEEHILDPNEGGESSEDEYVVTEEMMKFLEISMKHKAEMKQKKAQESKSKQPRDLPEERKTSERDALDECLPPSEKTVDGKRLEEMQLLYGASAPMIMGMETALQLNFNRHCDLFKPSYWPILPLQIKFS